MGDIRTTEGQSLPLTIPEKKKRRRIIALAIVAVIALIAIAGLLIQIERYLTATGYVTSEYYAEVRPADTGRVAEILASTGTVVEQGQVLVRLDDTDERASLAEARSQVRRLEAELVRRQAEIGEARRDHDLSLAEARFLLEDIRQSINRLETALDQDVSDSSEFSAELASLQAARDQVRNMRAQLVRREAEIAQDRQQLQWDRQEAKLQLDNAASTATRTAQLVESKLASGAALDEARLQEQLARVKLNALQARDESIFDKELAVLRQELQAREANVHHAEARLRRRLDDLRLDEKLSALKLQALENKDLTIFDKELEVMRQELASGEEVVHRAEARVQAREVRAPIAGQVLRYEFVIGELVRPETVLMELFGGEQKVLKVRIPERFATRVAPGQPYEAELAPYRGLKSVTFTGEVEALRNVIQAEGQNTYRVAHCDFDAQGHPVPPGVSAEAHIYYGHSNLWFYLFGVD